MSTNNIVLATITEEDITSKREALREHEEAAALIRTWLNAAEVITGPTAKAGVRQARTSATIAKIAADRKTIGNLGMDLTKAIEQHAVASPEPITKADLKERLRLEGFAESRLQNFFYTVIARLKAKNRIQVLEDGRVWKPR